jgi:hypothetical protein
MSDSTGKLAEGLVSGAVSEQAALRSLAELFRESLRLMERLENDIQHVRSMTRR